MKNMKYNMLLLILCAGLFQCSLCLAARENSIEIMRDTSNGIFNVSGQAETKKSGIPVTMNVYPQGKTEADMESSDIKSDIMIYHNETYTDDAGRYSFRLRLKKPSGIYDGYLYTGDSGERKKIRFEHINIDENKHALEGLNDAGDKVKFIDDNRSQLGFFMELYDKADHEIVVSLMKKYMPLDVNDAESAVSLFEQLTLINGLNMNKIKNIDDYRDKPTALVQKDSKLTKWYDGFVTEPSAQASLTAFLSGQNFSSVEEFNARLTEGVIMEVIKNPDGFGNVQKIINEFKHEIEIEAPTSNAEVYKSLSGNTYSGYEKLREAYAELTGGGSKPSYTNNGTGGKNSGHGYSFAAPGNVNQNPPSEVILPDDSNEDHSTVFTDLATVPWAVEAITALKSKGVIQGKENDKFHPDESVTREEFVKMTVMTFGVPAVGKRAPFKDAEDGLWYTPYIADAYASGIVKGIADDIFGTGMPISREDMAVMLYNTICVLGKKFKTEADEMKFADSGQISAYAIEAVAWLTKTGVINGSDGCFYPQDHATRAEAAKMIYKLMDAVDHND